MFQTVFTLVLLMFSFPLFADADLSLIQDLVGTYPVVDYLGNPLVAGKAEIFANETEIGLRLVPMKLSSQPVPNLVISSPTKETVLKRDAKGIYQTFEKGTDQTRIDYTFADGFLFIDASQCGANHCVKDSSMSLSRGGAPGMKVDTLEFLKKVRGNYKIEKVAGEAAHEETNTGEWIESEEPGEEMLRFPYCQPTGCDPGFINIKQSELSVYQKDSVYTLMVKSGSKLLHFSWQEKTDGTLVFTNYQFKLLTKEVVALEYVLQKA
jgi:hypothetical protein